MDKQHYLFVDCDDTLVRWEPDPDEETGLYRGDRYTINHELVSNIKCWLGEHPEYKLTVWSGGGMLYAAMWAEKAFGPKGWMIIDKNMSHPEDKDICIDDMPIEPRDKRVKVYLPSITKCPICQENDAVSRPEGSIK